MVTSIVTKFDINIEISTLHTCGELYFSTLILGAEEGAQLKYGLNISLGIECKGEKCRSPKGVHYFSFSETIQTKNLKSHGGSCAWEFGHNIHSVVSYYLL